MPQCSFFLIHLKKALHDKNHPKLAAAMQKWDEYTCAALNGKHALSLGNGVVFSLHDAAQSLWCQERTTPIFSEFYSRSAAASTLPCHSCWHRREGGGGGGENVLEASLPVCLPSRLAVHPYIHLTTYCSFRKHFRVYYQANCAISALCWQKKKRSVKHISLLCPSQQSTAVILGSQRG